MSNFQRGLWTFLMYALVGPFFAALAVAFVIAFASAFGLAPLLPGGEPPPIGPSAISTFVWAPLPAIVSGLVLAIVVVRTGAFGWMLAAAIAVIAFAIFSMLLPTWLADARPYLAFLAGLVSIGVRQVLVAAGILPD
jgi:hypothetical protein